MFLFGWLVGFGFLFDCFLYHLVFVSSIASGVEV